MSGWRELYTDQNRRLTRALLEKQGEINELTRRLNLALDTMGVCPFDCDHCHGEDCPCERLGCAGHKDPYETP